MSKNKNQTPRQGSGQDGFFIMLIMIALILITVIWLAFNRINSTDP